MREISPSSLQRVPLDDDNEDYDFGLAMTLSLKDFTLRRTSGRKSRAGQRSDDGLKGLGIAIPELSATRGRAQVRLTPSRSGRGGGQTRSLSARRPQSWSEPSPGIWSIKEEKESDEEVAKTSAKSESKEMGLSVSAPATSYIEQKAIKSPKPKKRVHWAM
jgi:hypothetical protein